MLAFFTRHLQTPSFSLSSSLSVIDVYRYRLLPLTFCSQSVYAQSSSILPTPEIVLPLPTPRPNTSFRTICST